MTEQRKIVTDHPENSETPIEEVCSWVTPNRLFFVRDHSDIPRIDLAKWRLEISGGVDQPCTWTWDELTALPTRSVFATVECAGNGRSFLQPKAHGVQWGAGAIGHAEWTGVSLKLLLDKAGVRRDATEIVFYGADECTESDHPETMNFARSLPLAKALHPDTLVAYRMNGETLEPNHGFPVRLFVPGWYGVASVKWLTKMDVVAQPFKGYYQTKKYTYERMTARGPEMEIVGPMVVKSEIIRPRAGDTLGIGTNRIFGVAWAGEDSVAAVEVSVDGGRTWSDAELLGPRARYSWCLWEYLWEESAAGSYSVVSRAVSSSVEIQPQSHDPLRHGYMINFCRPIDVTILESVDSTAQLGDAATLVYDMNAFAEDNSQMQLDVEMEYLAGGGI